MRAPGCFTVAVRRPDGTVAVKEESMAAPERSKLWKLPGFRGVATLVESMRLGYRALHFSAEQQMTAEEKAKPGNVNSNVAILISVAFAIGLFIALPQGLAWGAGKVFHSELLPSDWRYQAIIGGFKLAVITSYMVFLSRVPEMRRVFQYHGAEHKTIFAYEAGLPLTVENVRAQSTLHPRCGTTFLIVVVAVSVLVFIAVAPMVSFMTGFLGQIQVLAMRLLLLPLIAAIAYELQRFSAKYCTTGPLRVLLWPGFLFQKITTREPDEEQIEIAIAAMQSAEWREKVGAQVPVATEPRVFPNFRGFQDALSAWPTAQAAE